MRLQFEHGDITLYGWVPVEMKLHGLFQKEDLIIIKNMLNNFSITTENRDTDKSKKVKGRFHDIIYNEEVAIEYGSLDDKSNRYTEIIKLMLLDQWAWIKYRKHVRVIDDSNAVESLRIAEKATSIAQNF